MRSDPSENAQHSFLLYNYPRVFPLLEQQLGISREQIDCVPALENLTVASSVKNEAFILRIKRVLDAAQIGFEKAARIKASIGCGYRDLLKLRSGRLGRVSDMVLYPVSHEQVQKIVNLAVEYDVSLIPVGAGSNSVGAIAPTESEARMSVALDLSRMNQVLAIDERSNIAIVEAGITTQKLQQTLKQFNLAPAWDLSVSQTATIGGTLAIGNRLISKNCGDNRDLFLNCRMATPIGSIDSQVKSTISHPLCIENLAIGSEGTLGIITEVAIALRPVAERTDHWAISFPDFECAVNALHEINLSSCSPSNSKLLDPTATTLTSLLELKQGWIRSTSAKIKEWYITKQGHTNSCLLLLEYRGTANLVHDLSRRALAICRNHKGLALSPGRAKEILTAESKVIHLRNLLLDHRALVDSVTASVSWNNLLKLQKGVLEGVNQSLALWGEKGAVLSYISSADSSAALITFCFATRQAKDREIEQAEIVRADTIKLIRAFGGALHLGSGIGLLNQPHIKSELGEAAIEAMKAIKRKIDPQNIMNPGKSYAQRREATVTKRFVEPLTASDRRRINTEKPVALIQ